MSALFSAAKLADTKLPELPGIQSVDLARRQSSSIDNFQSDRLSKGGLFMLCALGSATFSKVSKETKLCCRKPESHEKQDEKERARLRRFFFYVDC